MAVTISVMSTRLVVPTITMPTTLMAWLRSDILDLD